MRNTAALLLLLLFLNISASQTREQRLTKLVAHINIACMAYYAFEILVVRCCTLYKSRLTVFPQIPLLFMLLLGMLVAIQLK